MALGCVGTLDDAPCHGAGLRGCDARPIHLAGAGALALRPRRRRVLVLRNPVVRVRVDHGGSIWNPESRNELRAALYRMGRGRHYRTYYRGARV